MTALARALRQQVEFARQLWTDSNNPDGSGPAV
jgi:hypothetical protein